MHQRLQQTEGEQEEKQETPKPLTVDDIRTAISDMRNDERASAKELDALTDLYDLQLLVWWRWNYGTPLR